MQRKCGLMLHITSLPNKYGFGCFSKEAFEFIDFLKKSGQHYWQVLPFNPTNESGSPFQCYSVFVSSLFLLVLAVIYITTQSSRNSTNEPASNA